MSHRVDAFEEALEAQELARLERKIAYAAARSDLESYGLCRRDEQQRRWVDLNQLFESADCPTFIEDALNYLELAKLIEFDPEDEGIVRILDLPADATVSSGVSA